MAMAMEHSAAVGETVASADEVDQAVVVPDDEASTRKFSFTDGTTLLWLAVTAVWTVAYFIPSLNSG